MTALTVPLVGTISRLRGDLLDLEEERRRPPMI